MLVGTLHAEYSQAAIKPGWAHDLHIGGAEDAEGAWLEWWPEPTIPYRHARYQQVTTLRAAPGSVLVWGEVLLPGRVAHGELHAYDWLALEVRIEDLTGRPVAEDRQQFVPLSRSLTAPGRARDWPVMAAVYLLAPEQPAAILLDALVEMAEAMPGVLLGASLLPERSGIAVRVLAHSSERATSLLASIRALAHRHLAEPC